MTTLSGVATMVVLTPAGRTLTPLADGAGIIGTTNASDTEPRKNRNKKRVLFRGEFSTGHAVKIEMGVSKLQTYCCFAGTGIWGRDRSWLDGVGVCVFASNPLLRARGRTRGSLD